MLGLKRGTVELAPYHPEWVELFELEKRLLTDTFGDTIVAIEHVGSTAIPGMPAKPIIDINIGVESLENARGMKDTFEGLGYEYRPFVPGHTFEDLRAQELYVKGPETKRTHHTHVTRYDSDFWKRSLLFRDYLRIHPDRAQEYAELKTRLAQDHADDREGYSQHKSQFILQTLETARAQLQADGTRVGVPQVTDWRPLAIEQIQENLGEFRDWCLCGGLSLDVFLGRITRSHGDTDIGVFRSDTTTCLQAISVGRVYLCLPSVGLTPWDGGEVPEEVHDIWITDPCGSHWVLQIMVYDDIGDMVIFRRSPEITWSKSAHTMCTGGIRILNPLVTLLFKATSSRLEAKDTEDIGRLIEGSVGAGIDRNEPPCPGGEAYGK
jgi:GrpB-like predicted nucleotidyltransferase (UPF0157 family)